VDEGGEAGVGGVEEGMFVVIVVAVWEDDTGTSMEDD